jgi:hypothetical protein
MQAEPLHEVDAIAADTMHREWPQHETRLGRAPRRRERTRVARAVALCDPDDARGVFRAIATIGWRPLEGPELDPGHQFFGRP